MDDPLKCGSVDAQDARCLRDIAITPLEHAIDIIPLNASERRKRGEIDLRRWVIVRPDDVGKRKWFRLHILSACAHRGYAHGRRDETTAGDNSLYVRLES